MKIIKNIFFGIKVFLKFFYAFIALFISIMLAWEIISVVFATIYRNWLDVAQILVFILSNVFLVFLMWYILFSKRNIALKVILFILLCQVWCHIGDIPKPQHREYFLDFDYCLEDGQCNKGRKLILKNNEVITINKETCIKYDWEWYEKGGNCSIFGNDLAQKIKPRAYELDKEDCVKEGYCWDGNRKFCEAKEPRYCIVNKNECKDKDGKWDNFFKTCKIN